MQGRWGALWNRQPFGWQVYRRPGPPGTAGLIRGFARGFVPGVNWAGDHLPSFRDRVYSPMDRVHSFKDRVDSLKSGMHSSRELVSSNNLLQFIRTPAAPRLKGVGAGGGVRKLRIAASAWFFMWEDRSPQRSMLCGLVMIHGFCHLGKFGVTLLAWGRPAAKPNPYDRARGLHRKHNMCSMLRRDSPMMCSCASLKVSKKVYI